MNGEYSDFSVDWYKDVGGSLITTMTVQSIMPWILFCVQFGKKYLRRYRDIGKLSMDNVEITKAKTY